jgi:choline kinase/ubiquinone/menaquinone biosynthesis C-methylase UbiE
MKAIIIGAGRGIRLMPETESMPKCMMDGIGGKCLLDWILDSLAHAGIDDVVFIGGYHMEKVVQAYPHLRFYHNTEWADNNVLESLMYAAPEMDTAFVASYSDIVYRRSVVQRLMDSDAEVALVVDRDWHRHCIGRTPYAESQAEKVVVEDGRVVEIGKHVPADRACGEFIGLAKFSREAACLMRDRYYQIHDDYLNRPFHKAPNIRAAYLTDMVQELVRLGVQIAPVDIWADWAELDTPQDLAWVKEQFNDWGEQGLAKQFWAVRAKGYEQLEWASRKGYLQAVVAAGDLRPGDRVLDLGTGTGIVAHAISPLVTEVVGVDLSPEMLAHARASRVANEIFEEGDARHLRFADNWFDKVIARMVLHHLIEGGDKTMRECYRVLKPGGALVLSEGVPPDPSLGNWYTSMFALKEERLTFFEQDLVSLVKKGGFDVEQVLTHVSPQVSIGNWLRNSGLPQERQDRIRQMHLELDEEGKKHYNMTLTGDDVLCDFKYVTIVGRKRP